MSEENTQERLRIFSLLLKRPNWVAILRQALEVESERDEEYEAKGLGKFSGFQPFHVNTYNQILLNMVVRGILYIAEDTGSSKCFRVRNPELIAEALESID